MKSPIGGGGIPGGMRLVGGPSKTEGGPEGIRLASPGGGTEKSTTFLFEKFRLSLVMTAIGVEELMTGMAGGVW